MVILISCRFSNADCRRCIVGLIQRIGTAYKNARNEETFILDLIEMDTPNLLYVQSCEKDNKIGADRLFIEMICTFIQKNALCEVIFRQIPKIMVWKF